MGDPVIELFIPFPPPPLYPPPPPFLPGHWVDQGFYESYIGKYAGALYYCKNGTWVEERLGTHQNWNNPIKGEYILNINRSNK